jgi:hypothetical protein
VTFVTEENARGRARLRQGIKKEDGNNELEVLDMG